MHMQFVVCVLTSLILVLLKYGESKRILLLPIPMGSHYMNMERVGRALMARGHEVHAYMNKDCQNTWRLAQTGVYMHTYTSSKGCLIDNKSFLKAYGEVFLKRNNLIQQLQEVMDLSNTLQSEIEGSATNTEAFKELNNSRFDLVIVDETFYVSFMHLLPYKLDIPVASFLICFEPIAVGIPGLPSFTPNVQLSTLTNEMTFMERVKNMLTITLLDTFLSTVLSVKSDNLISRFAPEKPFITMKQLKRRTILWLVRSDIVLDYPQVSMPHVINVGGMNTQPAKALPHKIQEIADKATDGLIIVSFGTFVSSLPKKIKQNLFEAFKLLNQTIIFSFNGAAVEPLPSHIHLMKWVPQNDLLAHPNTKMFITHCGANAQFEALYHSVPMLGLPVSEEQVYNSLRMAKKGLGIHMDIHTFKAEELVTAVKEILANDSYRKNIARRSFIFKDRPMTPMETLVYWVEHVMKYGSDHLVSPALHMPWYAYWCIDVIVFFCLVGIISISVCCFQIWLVCRFLCSIRVLKLKNE